MKKVCIPFCLMIAGSLYAGELNEEVDSGIIGTSLKDEQKNTLFLDALSRFRRSIRQEEFSETKQSALKKDQIIDAIKKLDPLTLQELLKTAHLTTQEKSEFLALANRMTTIQEDCMGSRINRRDALQLGAGIFAIGISRIFAIFCGGDITARRAVPAFVSFVCTLLFLAEGLRQLHAGLTKEERISKLTKAYAIQAMIGRV